MRRTGRGICLSKNFVTNFFLLIFVLFLHQKCFFPTKRTYSSYRYRRQPENSSLLASKRRRGRRRETWRRTASTKRRDGVGLLHWRQPDHRAKERAGWIADVVAVCRHEQEE